MAKKWVRIAIPAVTVTALVVFAWAWVKYLQQRPWPPEITSPEKTVVSGETYAIQWAPAGGGPQAEFYYVERSPDTSFLAPSRQKFVHNSSATTQTSGPIIAPAVLVGGKTYHYRVLAGYASKYFSKDDILSDPSGDVAFTVTHLPSPGLVSVPASVWSGKSYTVGFTAAGKANAYRLEETTPQKTQVHDLTATSKTFVAPPLSKDETYSYRVKAAVASGGSWTDITGWSNAKSLVIKHVSPPTALTIIPTSTHNPQPYKVTWKAPSSGPGPVSTYQYTLRETVGGQSPKVLPAQSTTAYSAKAPLTASKTSISYEVMASFGKNPMTAYSSASTITISPPPPPPAPIITKVLPASAPKGETVTITGDNFTGATVNLYASSPTSTVNITPASLTKTKITFKVPSGASLKTTDVGVTVGSTTTKKAFAVARQSGSFVQRQGSLKVVKQTCGSFTAEVDPPSYLNKFTGRFKKGNTTVVNITSKFVVSSSLKGGLGFSKGCRIGVQVAETQGGIVQPYNVVYYNLNMTQDSKTSPGVTIAGPHGFHIVDAAVWKDGYWLLFSPDETIAAVVGRNKLGPSKLWIVITDMLTGNQIYANGFSSPVFTLDINKHNEVLLKAGSLPATKIQIPKP